MIIPWQQLAPDTLINLIESFVLREGTDYGEQEKSLTQKAMEVEHQLKCGEVVLVWSRLHETINIISKQQYTTLNFDENDWPCIELSFRDKIC